MKNVLAFILILGSSTFASASSGGNPPPSQEALQCVLERNENGVLKKIPFSAWDVDHSSDSELSYGKINGSYFMNVYYNKHSKITVIKLDDVRSGASVITNSQYLMFSTSAGTATIKCTDVILK